MAKKNFINIYNNLVKFSRNKLIFSSFTQKDTFSDRLIIFLFHFGFFLKEFKKNQDKELLQEIFDYIFKELEISIREIGYGDASINKKMKNYLNVFHSILDKVERWEAFSEKDKEEIFKSYVNFDGNLTYLIDYFEKYRKFLSKKPFHFFTKGVIKNNF